MINARLKPQNDHKTAATFSAKSSKKSVIEAEDTSPVVLVFFRSLCNVQEKLAIQ